MKLYVFMNNENEILSKKGNSGGGYYRSKIDIDQFIIYRSYKKIEKVKKEFEFKKYNPDWMKLNMDIKQFQIKEIELNYKIIN